ncbi:MAG: hypothetical protein AAF243_08205 [Cyanobacteria bacterium P01_A01_bin.137]
MTGELEAQAYSVLATLAALLLLLVTGGVIYLTAVEWRDKRKRTQETLDTRTPVRKRQGPKKDSKKDPKKDQKKDPKKGQKKDKKKGQK